MNDTVFRMLQDGLRVQVNGRIIVEKSARTSDGSGRPCKKNAQLNLFNKLCVDHADVTGKRVLLRVDFNVPLKNGKITDNKRIRECLKTIDYILQKEPKCLIIMSHLGRPDGRPQEKYSLKPIVKTLEDIINRRVIFLNNCVGEETKNACFNATDGTVILLENLRFHIEEEGKGSGPNKEKLKASKEDIEKFRIALTDLGEIFVNDAFGACHRLHSSIVGINLPLRVSGFLLKKELEYFSKAVEKPDRPFLAILGGAKVADKILLIKSLLDKVNEMIICGGMAFTFLKVVSNMEIGDSLYDEKGSLIVKELMDKAHARRTQIHLPVDFTLGNKIAEDATRSTTNVANGIPRGWMGLDIGSESADNFSKVISRAKLIVWNGPPGVFEIDKFSQGSKLMLQAVCDATKSGATTIIAGGDTAAIVAKYNAESRVSHVSTGGGASLELLEGKVLPGVEYLSNED